MDAQAGLARGRARGAGHTSRSRFGTAAAIAAALTLVAALGVAASPGESNGS